MDGLKALLAKKKAAAVQHQEPGKKYVRRSELEEAELTRLRKEEQQELEAKAAKRRAAEEEQARAQRKRKHDAADNEQAAKQDAIPVLSPDEVIRRLRLLEQPATLFGESDFDRLKRLKQAEAEVQLDDDAAGGGVQANTVLALRKQEHQQKELAKKRAAIAKGTGGTPQKEGLTWGRTTPTQADEEAEGDELAAAFKQAAALIKEKQAEEKMQLEDKIIKYVKKWTKEWEIETENMPEDMRRTIAGHQAKLSFQQSKASFDPMYRQLRSQTMDPSLRNGLWEMVDAMCNRDYRAASEAYMKISIGNAPWPIGVTSIGIHERSAREKISHVMNTQGTAHIMTDEATRRFLQGMKRLMTFVQRTYRTDPSKCMDYNGFKHMAPPQLSEAVLPRLEYNKEGLA